MNNVRASVSRNMSRLPRSHFVGKSFFPIVGPINVARIVPVIHNVTTTETRRIMPARKSSCLPSLAWRASFGSSAAWMAWNMSSGMRAMKTPVMKPAVIVFRCVGVARICTPSTLMYDSVCAKIEATSSNASALESSE